MQNKQGYAVYNGKCRLIVQNRNFMLKKDVLACMNVLNNKKCEGFDRIPVCILADAKPVLLTVIPHVLPTSCCPLMESKLIT